MNRIIILGSTGFLGRSLRQKLSDEKFNVKYRFKKYFDHKILVNNKIIKKKFEMFVLKENKPGFPLLLHEEPIYLENKIIGKTTSGNYSFNYNKNISFGYVNTELSNDELKDKKIYIEIEKQKYLAEVLFKPLKQSDYKLI